MPITSVRHKGMHQDGLPHRILTYLATQEHATYYKVIAQKLRHNPRAVVKMCSNLANRGYLRWTKEGHYRLRGTERDGA